MAIYEQDKVFYSEESNGDKTIYLPITRANNVEGLGRSTNTTYSVGDVVYVDTNKAIALKCTTAGTTSDSELDISTNVVGDSVADGGVVWEVLARDTLNALPLSGGTLTGELKLQSKNAIRCANNNECRILADSEGELGTGVYLRAETSLNNDGYEGTVTIRSKKDSNLTDLRVLPNGVATINSNMIIDAHNVWAAYTITPNQSVYLPAGGTWRGLWAESVADNNYCANGAFELAGGSLIRTTAGNLTAFSVFAIKIA